MTTLGGATGFGVSGSVGQAEELLVGIAMGKWQDLTGLVIDHACDNPQHPQSQYPIPFEFREELCAVCGCLGKDVYKVTAAWTVSVITSL